MSSTAQAGTRAIVSTVQFTAEDHAFMARAIALTERGRDTATPNPAVGCVIAGIRETRKPNHYRRDVLPPPSRNCTRAYPDV